MLIDMEAVRTAAKNNAVTPCYPANPANPANGKHGEISNVSSVSKVAGGGSNALPPDPGMAQLLALAMAYCDRTGASDKARADWRSDMQATSPGQREGLAAYLRGPLAKLVSTAPASTTWRKAAKPLPKFHRAQPWNALDRAFQAHYWQCPDCKVAGRTRGPLCAQGQPLKDAVDQAFAAA